MTQYERMDNELGEKDDKIDALRTELAATRLAYEDWVKIATNGDNKLNIAVRTLDLERAVRKELERKLDDLWRSAVAHTDADCVGEGAQGFTPHSPLPVRWIKERE